MIELVPAQQKIFTVEKHDGSPMQVVASFNGKIYNGKRYFNCQYRLDNKKARQYTCIYQDGQGWVESVSSWECDLEEAFELVEKEVPTLSFGKYVGKKLSEVPASYLKWLIIHKNVLNAKNQAVIEDVKAFLA